MHILQKFVPLKPEHKKERQTFLHLSSISIWKFYIYFMFYHLKPISQNLFSWLCK